MALLTNRDPLVVAAAVARWFAATTDARDVQVVDAEHPSVGYSSETILVDLTSASDRGEQAHALVVRLAPPTAGTFRDYDLAQQTVAQLAAASAGVAIASPELVTDREWLGVPFLVMPRVDGHIIGDSTLHDPWLNTLTERQRSRVHEAFVAAVAATHRADLVHAAGVPGTRQRGRDRFLGRLPRLVERGLAPFRTRRRPRLVSRPPTRDGARTGPAVGRRSTRQRDLRRRPGAARRPRLGHDVHRRARARRCVVHDARIHDAVVVRQASGRIPRPRRDDRAVRVAQRTHTAGLRVVRDSWRSSAARRS